MAAPAVELGVEAATENEKGREKAQNESQLEWTETCCYSQVTAVLLNCHFFSSSFSVKHTWDRLCGSFGMWA